MLNGTPIATMRCHGRLALVTQHGDRTYISVRHYGKTVTRELLNGLPRANALPTEAARTLRLFVPAGFSVQRFVRDYYGIPGCPIRVERPSPWRRLPAGVQTTGEAS